MNIPKKTPVGTATVTIPAHLREKYSNLAKQAGYSCAELITLVLREGYEEARLSIQGHEEPVIQPDEG